MKILNNKILTVIFSALAIFALSGCGSEGIPSNDELVGGTLPPAATAPVYYLNIDAGQDKSVSDGDNVSLHGVASTDELNASLKAVWVQIDGNFTVSLTDADTFNPTFVAPYVQVKTLLTFKLQVSSGALVSEDIVTITVLPTTLPQVLPANVITTHSGSSVTAHSGTLPPRPGQTFTHLWTQVSGPSVTLTTPNGTSTGFVAPNATGTIVLSHTVTNTTTGTKTITLHTFHVVAPTIKLSVIVSPPLKIFETIDASFHVSASGGTGSYTYVWSQKSGVGVGLDQTDPQNPIVITPPVTQNEVIELQVVVSDGSNSITKILPMIINNVTLAVKASSDVLTQGSHKTHLHVTPIATANIPVLNPITYHWSETSGSNTPIIHAASANPEISLPGGSGTYTFKVEATDTIGNSATDTVTITVLDDLHANAGKDFIAVEDNDVSLHGLSTGVFGAAQIAWTQLTGKIVPLKDAGTMNPTFKAPILNTVNPEIFTFELAVTDDKGRVKKDTVDVTITPLLAKVSIKAVTTMPASSKTSPICHASGGVAPFTFVWSVTPGTDASLSNQTDVSPDSLVYIEAISSSNSPVTLSCEVTDAHGRKVAATHNISIYAVPPTVALKVQTLLTQSVIEGQKVSLTAFATGGSGNYTYEWETTHNRGTIGDKTHATTSFEANYVSQDTYEYLAVTVTDTNGDTVTGTEVIGITNVPLKVNIVGPDTALQGQQVNFTSIVSGGSGNYTYEWNSGFGTSATYTYDTNLVKGSPIPLVLKVTDTVNGVSEEKEVIKQITIKPYILTIQGQNELRGSIGGSVPVDLSMADTHYKISNPTTGHTYGCKVTLAAPTTDVDVACHKDNAQGTDIYISARVNNNKPHGDYLYVINLEMFDEATPAIKGTKRIFLKVHF